MECKFSFDFKLNVKMKFTLGMRIFCKRSLALMGHHTVVIIVIMFQNKVHVNRKHIWDYLGLAVTMINQNYTLIFPIQ